MRDRRCRRRRRFRREILVDIWMSLKKRDLTGRDDPEMIDLLRRKRDQRRSCMKEVLATEIETLELRRRWNRRQRD